MLLDIFAGHPAGLVHSESTSVRQIGQVLTLAIDNIQIVVQMKIETGHAQLH